jgi:IPT/TIG domain
MKMFAKGHLKLVLAVSLWILLGANLGLAADSLPTRTWSDQKEGGYNRNDVGYSVAIDSQRNVIVSGYKAGYVGTEDHAIDAHAIKYDPNGNVLCTITVDSGPKGGTGGADSSDVFAAVKVDSEDNIILAGTTSGDYYSLGYWTAPYIRKYDSNCNPVWPQPKIINYDPWNSAWQNSQEIAFDKDGNIYVGGAVFGYWGGAEGEWAIWKFDKDGNAYSGFPILYNYSWNYYIPDYAYGIAVDSVGNIIAAGMKGVSGCDGCLNKNYDWHVRKYDPSGALLWEDTYSGAANLLDYAYKVAVDSKDDIIVVGFTNIGTDNSTNANYDWLVIKYAKDGVGKVGQRLWTKTYESAPGRVEQALNVTVDGSDNAVVVGYVRDATNSYNMGRVALLSGVDGSQLDEIVFPEVNVILYGVAQRGNLIAVSGYIGVSPNLDMFTALLAPSLTFPAEGTAWESLSKQTILWDKTLISGKSKVSLYYSTDSGGTWIPLKENTGNSGKYVWTLPDITPLESIDTCVAMVQSVDPPQESLASPLFSIGFPKINDFNNKKVFIGETITITGQFFGTKAGKVNFGKSKGKVAAGGWTPASITVQVPKNALTGPFSIITAAKNEAASTGNLVILPQITKISPTSGSVDKKVNISGSGFGVAQGIVTFFNGIPANVLSWSDTKIAVEVPNGAATGRIRVTNAAADWAESPTDFEIIP